MSFTLGLLIYLVNRLKSLSTVQLIIIVDCELNRLAKVTNFKGSLNISQLTNQVNVLTIRWLSSIG